MHIIHFETVQGEDVSEGCDLLAVALLSGGEDSDYTNQDAGEHDDDGHCSQGHWEHSPFGAQAVNGDVASIALAEFFTFDVALETPTFRVGVEVWDGVVDTS